MGCDIHCFVQYQNSIGKWQTVYAPDKHQFYEGRNYVLFGILSGVRGDCRVLCPKPLLVPGLPCDATIVKSADGTLYMDQEDPDHWLGEHSFGWRSWSDLWWDCSNYHNIKKNYKERLQAWYDLTTFLNEATVFIVDQTQISIGTGICNTCRIIVGYDS